MSEHGGETRVVEFEIHWSSYDNDDMAEVDDYGPDPAPDEGWYIDATLPDGTGFDLGPDHFGPGLTSLDHALGMIETWAKQRGGSLDREYGVTVKATVLFGSSAPPTPGAPDE